MQSENDSIESLDQTDVMAALALLVETLDLERQRLNQEGARAMQGGDYETANEVIQFAKLLVDFHDDVGNLTEKWKELEKTRDSSSPTTRKIVGRSIFQSRNATQRGGFSRTATTRTRSVNNPQCVDHCFHLLDFVVSKGGFALAREASDYVNRIVPMKWPHLRAAKTVMMEKNWISRKTSNRELRITAAGRAWYSRQKAAR